MLVFPKIANPDYPFTVEPEDNSISSTFEDGTVQSRLKFTRSRDSYQLTWSNMSADDFKKLFSFIKNEAHFRALTFQWTNPLTGDTHEVRCMEFTNLSNTRLNFWSARIKLQEV
jgi:phage-related protein